MGGPTSAVLLPAELNQSQTEQLEQWLHSVGHEVRAGQFGGWDFSIGDATASGDFSGSDRPFAICLFKPELEPHEAAVVKSHFGFLPRQALQIDAFCNGKEDHKLLGWLTLHLAERYNGIVDFLGALLPPLPLRSGAESWENWSDFAAAFDVWAEEMPGKIVSVEYETGNGRQWASHKADVHFFRAWLKHPQFGMIK